MPLAEFLLAFFVGNDGVLVCVVSLNFYTMAQHISNHRFVSALRDIIKNDRYDSIREAVAKEALAHTSPVQFLENVVQQGCSIAGEVFCFNSINDTLAFYDSIIMKLKRFVKIMKKIAVLQIL
ncbi:MAG: hypothetical protein MJK04_14960 [Psychrosphaera sp.]|nr:hypothetical protein [Psychrosphaera sp.]